MPQPQERRITDAEMNLLKNTFAENEPILKTMRKAFLGLPMSKDENTNLTYLFKDSSVLQTLMRKIFLPEIDGDAPLGQQLDLWMTVQFADKTPEMAQLFMRSRRNLITLIELGLDSLIKPEENTVISAFELTDDAEQDYIQLLTRNTYINHIDQQLIQIKFLAGQTDETVEQTKNRLAKDSSK